MMKTLLLILIILTSHQAKSQLQGQAKIDSLLKELPKMKDDTNSVNLLVDLSFEYYRINTNKGIKYGKQGLKLAEKIDWNLGKARCYNSLGANNLLKSDYIKALNYYNKALKINQELEYKSEVAMNLGNIGNILYFQSNYPKALHYYLEALKINEKLGRKSGIASTLGNIGNIYNNQSNYHKALEYYYKALKINEEIENKSGIANIIGNIGSVYSSQANNSKALKCYQKALKINKELGNKNAIATNLGNIGIIHKNQSNYPNAIKYFQKAVKNFEELGDKGSLAIGLGNLGELYLNISQDSIIENNENRIDLLLKREVNLNKAIEFSKRAIDLSNEIGALHQQSHFLNNISQAYELKGNYKKAYEIYKEHKKLNDSMFNLDKAKDFANLEAKRESEVKQKEIEILKAEKEKEKVQRYAMFGGIIGLGLVIALVMVQRRRSEKLLLNVLPASIAKRLKRKEHPIADHFENASIIFIDIVGFTSLSSGADPKRIVSVLNDIFTKFDKLADQFGLEKIKTIGDAYMAVCGIPDANPNHVKQTALMALSVKKEMDNYKTSDGTEIKFRIGIDCGPVVAGVIGNRKFIYDLWSDAVNTASRMESTSESSKIQITENFKEELEKYKEDWNIEFRGEFEIKGKGIMKTYYLENKI